jgi:hypothetical protein
VKRLAVVAVTFFALAAVMRIGYLIDQRATTAALSFVLFMLLLWPVAEDFRNRKDKP